uniref:Uncharacterized protein n=1 Tax=viral metagenome TaxID=1070528 RepID=A0A6C0EKE3_9ZZZZ
MYKHISNPKSNDTFNTETIEIMNHYFNKLKDPLDIKLYQDLKLFKDSKIYFKEFHNKYTDLVMDNVLEGIGEGTEAGEEGSIREGSSLLTNLKKNYSSEGGFTLPLTAQWIEAVELENKSQSLFLKYHGNRDFRFFGTGDYIQGLRTKDSMRYWSEEEVNELVKCVDMAVFRL